MSYCPSQDWDRECEAQDAAIAERLAWWQNPQNQMMVAKIAAALLSHPNTNPWDEKPEYVIDTAEKFAREITGRAVSPWE